MAFKNNELRYRATRAIRVVLFLDAGEVFFRIGAFGSTGWSSLAGWRAATSSSSGGMLLGMSAGFGREGEHLAFMGDLRF